MKKFFRIVMVAQLIYYAVKGVKDLFGNKEESSTGKEPKMR